MTDANPTPDPKPADEPTTEPNGDDQPPYFRDPAEQPKPDRPAEHVEPEEDEDGA